MNIRLLKKLIISLSVLAILLVGGSFALAGSIDVGIGYGDNIGLGTADPIQVTLNVINIFLGLLGLIVVILFLYAGFIWMTAAGSAEKVEKAKRIIKNAVIGLVIVLSAFGIVNWVVRALFDVTGASCTDGASRPCGCGGLGSQTCIGGAWDSCAGDCPVGQCCIADICQLCSNPVLTASIYPKGKWGIPLNGVGVVRFSRQIVPGSGSFTTKKAASMTDTAGAGVAFDSILKYDKNIEYNNQVTCQDISTAFPAANIIIPPGHELDKCFEPDTDNGTDFSSGYRVEAVNQKTAEGLLLALTTSNFSASSSVDFTPPKINFNYHTVCINTSNTLSAVVSDNWGVLEVEFYIDGVWVGTSSPAKISRNFNASVVTAAITAGTDHDIKIIARDIALNEDLYHKSLAGPLLQRRERYR
jgi:hypothetical protein